MNQLEFIKKLNKIVKENGYKDIISTLEDPSGRRPAETLKEMSEFYNSQDSKEVINNIISFSIESTIFSFLCLLDGVRKLDNENGSLQLFYDNSNSKKLLNNSEEDYLHDIFNSLE